MAFKNCFYEAQKSQERIFCLEGNSMVQSAAAVMRNQYLLLEISINNSLICSLISYTTVGKQCLNNSFHPLLANDVNKNGSAVKYFEVFHVERCYINNTFPPYLRKDNRNASCSLVCTTTV